MGMLTKQSLSWVSKTRQLEDMMASKSFCKGSRFSYIGLNEVELPVSERSEYPRFLSFKTEKSCTSYLQIETLRAFTFRPSLVRWLRSQEDFDYHRPEKELFDSFENEQPRNWKVCPKKNVRRCLYFALYAIFLSWTYDLPSWLKIACRGDIFGVYASICLCMANQTNRGMMEDVDSCYRTRFRLD